MDFQLGKRRDARSAGRPELEPFGDDKVIGSSHWLAEDGTRSERYQVLTIRDGKIVDIQGCASRHEAERFARRGRAA